MPFHAHTSKLPDGKTTNPDTGLNRMQSSADPAAFIL